MGEKGLGLGFGSTVKKGRLCEEGKVRESVCREGDKKEEGEKNIFIITTVELK